MKYYLLNVIMDIKLKILVILFFIILFYKHFYFDNKIMTNENKIMTNQKNKEIIIIGDLHGNRDALIAILKNENVIDKNNKLIGMIFLIFMCLSILI